jgi:hypothetical protein
MMMRTPVHNLGEGYSKDAREGSYSKRPRGRHPKIGHFHDDVDPTHFTKVVLAPGVGNSSNSTRLPSIPWNHPKGNHREYEHRLLLDGEAQEREWHNCHGSRVA